MPDYLKYQLSQKQFADVYTGLQVNAVVETKVFFHDLGADGLHPAGEMVDDARYTHLLTLALEAVRAQTTPSLYP